jgi:hypothetical protein
MNEDPNSGLIPVTDNDLFGAPTTRSYQPGQTIFSRFVLTRVLGRGGMGIVWLAQDLQLELEVAIKVLPDVVMHDREAVTDMKRETKRSLQLNHHNIVRIYDFNQDEMGVGISMEYVDGLTLSAAKTDRPHGCFDVEDVAPWVEQVCDALNYAHNTAKIVHRDLKPANIMLNSTNTIKVTDFGIARSISDSVSRVSMRHASSGTMVYMSPQQSSGSRSTPSDDIYALGATIYDLITGKPPFYSGNIQHQLENITPPSMAERRMELDRHGSPIPAVWERVIASCLEKEPQRRPASVLELATQLGLRPASAGLYPTTSTAGTSYASAPALSATPAYVPPPTSVPPPATYAPPPPPSGPTPGFFTPARVKIMCGVAAGLVLLGIVAGVISLLTRGHGSVAVATMPPGAVVTIDGQQMTTPATFDSVPAGDTKATITLDGYDPLSVPVHVAKNDRADLGVSTLTRSTGIVAVTIIPPQATCTLRLVQPDVAGETPGSVASFPGTAPWQSPPLKTGRYEIITTASGFPEGHDEIQIKRGDTARLVVDLIKEQAGKSLLGDELAAVESGGALPSKFRDDADAKARLTAYYRKAFDGYMQAEQFDLAEGQLKHLNSDLGIATPDEEKQVSDGRLIAVNGQGTVSVKTDPPGAAVTLNGKTMGSPAIFNRVLAGPATVQIKMQGYDPVEDPVQVTRDLVSDMGTIALTRCTGAVEITTIPRHASGSLKLTRSDAPSESPGSVGSFSGPESYHATGLGTGSYSVSASGEGLSATKAFDLRRGDNLKITLDLVSEEATHPLSPDLVSAAQSSQPLPGALVQNPTAKAALTTYYQQVFQGYVKLKEFKLAEEALKHLNGELGAGSPQDEQALQGLEADWLASEKTNLTQLIQQEHFDQADALLADMESHGPQPEMRDQLNKAKAAHEQAVTQALANIDSLESAGNEPGAYQAAVAAVNADKIEPRLALRIATLELPMSSTYERVSSRVKAMNSLLAADPALAQNADFNRILGIFQKNLDKHEDFKRQIAEAKQAVGGYDSKISELRAERKHNEDKANGYRALNVAGFGGFLAGLSQNSGAGAAAGVGASAVGAKGASDREADIRAINGRISDLEAEQSSKQAVLDQVRGQYDAFCKGPINATQ